MRIGAMYRGKECCEFVVLAPKAHKMAVKIVAPIPRIVPMERLGLGYWKLHLQGIPPGTRYLYRIDDAVDRPDPASRSQPEGVHGPSEVVDHALFPWTDGSWCGLPPEDTVIYELHVGTFTLEGSFSAVIPRLGELREMGITCIELMPVAQFPGERDWGYDGTYPFAVQNSYGGPDGLKLLVNACHGLGLAVILDVVYNHLGPEGNYLRDFGPYFTDRHRTPWGEAINFDGADSDEVRNYFIENALYWMRDYHIDALRLDAIHAICDTAAKPFLQELAERVEEFSPGKGRHRLIAESDLNDARVIRPQEMGGYGLDAQWNDDFHHALHTLLSGEKQGYYADFGTADDLAKAYREGFVYSWHYSPYRRRRHGSSSIDRPGSQFVVCSQNHDQVGNRMQGERLISLAGFEGAKVAAAAVFFSPYIPLLFMGEEYGEEAPFLFFVDYSDPLLQEGVRRGRKEEFRSFGWSKEPPDPQATETFLRSKIDWEKRFKGKNRVLLDFYRELMRLRRKLPALRTLDKEHLDVTTSGEGNLLVLRRGETDSRAIALLNFGLQEVAFLFPEVRGDWRKVLDSADASWLGSGTSLPNRVDGGRGLIIPPLSAALYTPEEGEEGFS